MALGILAYIPNCVTASPVLPLVKGITVHVEHGDVGPPFIPPLIFIPDLRLEGEPIQTCCVGVDDLFAVNGALDRKGQFWPSGYLTNPWREYHAAGFSGRGLAEGGWRHLAASYRKVTLCFKVESGCLAGIKDVNGSLYLLPYLWLTRKSELTGEHPRSFVPTEIGPDFTERKIGNISGLASFPGQLLR